MNSMTPISKLVSKRYFNAPRPAPSQWLSQPSDTASIARVSREATREKSKGTASQMKTNASTCATVIESVSVGHSFAANEAYKAFAASKPTISPSKEASCFKKPFIKPITAPKPKAANMMMSIVAIKSMC